MATPKKMTASELRNTEHPWVLESLNKVLRSVDIRNLNNKAIVDLRTRTVNPNCTKDDIIPLFLEVQEILGLDSIVGGMTVKSLKEHLDKVGISRQSLKVKSEFIQRFIEGLDGKAPMKVTEGKGRGIIMRQPMSDESIRRCIVAVANAYRSMLNAYREACHADEVLHNEGSAKGFRAPNFHERISELLAFVAMKKRGYPVMNLEVKNGDLVILFEGRYHPVEVKASCGKGPSSFGPKEQWLYLVYVRIFEYTHCSVSVIKIANTDDRFQTLILNHKPHPANQKVERVEGIEETEDDKPVITGETYAQQCARGVRPRFNIEKFISEHVKPEDMDILCERADIFDLLMSY